MLLPKLTVSNYPEMLRKITAGTFVALWISIHLIRSASPYLAQLLDAFEASLPTGFPVGLVDPSKVIVAEVLPAFLLAVLLELVRLHDRISDLFRIREEFDISHIVLPMACLCGAQLSESEFNDLRPRRDQIMRNVFYKYASGFDSVIDKHYVTMALTRWSWYWMAAEAAFVFTITSGILLFLEAHSAASYLSLIVVILLVSMRWLKLACVRNARTQIFEIANDGPRRSAIKSYFASL